MGLLRKISLSIAALVLLPIIGVCIWLFVYTRDLPDLDRLSRFASSVDSVVSDSCLEGPCRSSKLDLRRIDGPYLQRMPPASGWSVVSDRDGLRSIARCNSIHPTVAVIRPWPASVTQLSARCTDDEDRRCEARPEVGVVRSGVAQPAGPPASSSLGRCACGQKTLTA